MASMNEYKSKAKNAVTKGNAVLQDAESTLKTLKGKNSTLKFTETLFYTSMATNVH